MANPKHFQSKESKVEVASTRKTVRIVKEHFQKSGDPELVALAPHVTGGMRIVHYTLEATSKLKKVLPPPRGCALEHVSVVATTERGGKEIEAANWMLRAVEAQLGRSRQENIDAAFDRLERPE